MSTLAAQASGRFMIGGDIPVHRLGFGAMRVTGALPRQKCSRIIGRCLA